MLRCLLFTIAITACTHANPVGDGPPNGSGDASDHNTDAIRVDAIPGADIATESCTHTASYGGTTANYAEHAYPGKTSADLSRVIARLHINPGNGYTLPGYQYEVSETFVNDGMAAVVCGYTTVQYFDSVTFILPP